MAKTRRRDAGGSKPKKNVFSPESATRAKTATRANNRVNGHRLIDLRKISAIMRKNLTVILRDKTRLLPLLMFPIFMIIIFGYTSGAAPKHIPAGIIAYDHSPLSQQIQEDISASQTFTVRHVVSTEGEGKRLLDKGEVGVLIIIPASLEDDVNAGRQTGITVIVDESDSAISATSRNALTAIIDARSTQLSEKRIAALQQSVDSAARKLQASALAQQDSYDLIGKFTATGEEALVRAVGAVAAERAVVAATATSPMLFVQHTATSDKLFINAQKTTLVETAASAGANTQLSLLDNALTSLTQATKNVQVAHALANNAEEQGNAQQSFSAQQANVGKPLQAIKVFTAYKPHDLRAPIVYEEKPAYGTGKRAVDFLIPAIIALTIFQGAVMGMGRSVAGEKREGSLTRVFLTPTSNATIILGTLLFYIIFEIFRSTFLILFAVTLFHVKIEGSLLLIGLVLIIYAGVSTGIGMILSSMVSTEQQYQGVSLLVGMPTIFLAGVFFPLEAMPKVFQVLASFLPVTYAGEALRDIMIKGFGLSLILSPLFILLIFLGGTLSVLFIVFKRDIE